MRSSISEIDLHNLTVDDALYQLERYLNKSVREGLDVVWVIRGKGEGVLRSEVHRHLTGHKLVGEFRLADYYHGGNGVTRVELSDW